MQMLTASEVCAQLRIKDPKTLYKLIRSGELPAIKVGAGERSSYRISEKSLAEFMERNAVKPVASAAGAADGGQVSEAAS